VKKIQPLSLSANTRKLLLVTFVTLTLTAFLFLVYITFFNRTNRAIFQNVENSLQVIAGDSKLNEMLTRLELDIRELIMVILKEPHRLQQEKASLLGQFDRIIEVAEARKSTPGLTSLMSQLGRYRKSFRILLDDHADVNAALYEIYFYINNFTEELSIMEQAAGRLMVDHAMLGRNTDALQQAYVLISLAQENLLESHILVNTSITNNNPALLGVRQHADQPKEKVTVADKINTMTNTLRTLTASKDKIRSFASHILENIPSFLGNISQLETYLHAMETHYREFKNERDQSLKLLDQLNMQGREKILSINAALTKHEERSTFLALIISLIVLLVSLTGLILTRKMGAQLEGTIQEVQQARTKEKELNRQLEEEVVERRDVAEELQRARDELEVRIKDRTADLSSANRSLALEVEERRNAEYALASEKERLTVTLRSIGDGVISTGVGGNILLVNKAAEKLTGWTQKESYSRRLSEIFHIVDGETGKTCKDAVERLVRTGKIFDEHTDTILVARDGTRRIIAENGSPIRDSNSQVVGVVVVFRDITEQHRMAAEALKVKKLESVGVLAGGIAHDFNNILAAILGNISLAQLNLSTDETKTRKLLEDAEKASLRARSLTQQLLTFSKGGEPVRKLAAIGDVIRESAGFVLSGGNVRCDYAIPDDLWSVNIDAGQISQVIQNIIINAMQAMPAGGVVNITCENYPADQQPQLKLPGMYYVKISIQDHGPGIPEELIGRVFDPYFTTKEDGSGLGLALTHSIIRKHEGMILAESGREGTVFTIYLPAVPGHTVSEDNIRLADIIRTTRGRIMIMDDDAMIRDIAGSMLAHLGYDVDTACDGEEALKLYEERMKTDTPVDIVIMDLTIPGGMGGREAVRKLKKLDPAARAVVSSGYSNDPVMSEYHRYGFAGVVNKPFQLNDLHEVVSRILGPVSGDKDEEKHGA
jgi:PAS domain S-box-containing protein